MQSSLPASHAHTRTGASRREPPSLSVNEAELHKKKKLSARPNVVECKMSVVNSQCSSSLRTTLSADASPHTPVFQKCKRKSGDGGKEEGPWHKRRPIVGAGAERGGNNPVSLGLCLDSPPPPATPRVIVRERSHGRIGVSHAFLAASSQTNTLLAVSPLVSVISLQWPPSSNCSLLPFSNAPPPRLASVHRGHFPLCDAES